MQLNLKLVIAIISTWLLCLSTALAQDGGQCYDPVQYPTQFSDLGTMSQIARALNETCEPPVGDSMYKCNAAKALNVPMPNNDSLSFAFHFASLHYVNQSIPDTGPCGDVYLSRASCVYLGLAAIGLCENGGEVTINETEAAGGGDQEPVTAWLQVVPFG